MKFYVLTLFPEMIAQGMGISIIKKAVEKGTISLEAVNIRDYTNNKHKKTDDYSYGRGVGMLMQAQPVFDAYQELLKQIKKKGSKQLHVIYLTPQGEVFSQKKASQLAKEEDIIFLCGRYEGMDERVLEETVTDYISLGDYVLTGGELPTMVVMDAIARLVPGVLNNGESAEAETFQNDLLEHPQYTRPREWHEKSVPDILLFGDNRKVADWQLEEARKRTKDRRPDLLEEYEKRRALATRLSGMDKLLYMDMTEALRRGNCEILKADEVGCILWDAQGKSYLMALFQDERADDMAACVKNPTSESHILVIHQAKLEQAILKRLKKPLWRFPSTQVVYTHHHSLPVTKELSFRTLDASFLEQVMMHYHTIQDPAYIMDRLVSGVVVGGYFGDELVGFIGRHSAGSLAMLEIFPEHRRKGYAIQLESEMINRILQEGSIPYAHVAYGNIKSMKLHEKLGFSASKGTIIELAISQH